MDVALLGPHSLISGSVVMRPFPGVEGMLTVGTQSAEFSESEGGTTASAKASINVFALRGRYLPFRNHLALEAGFAVSSISLSASGDNVLGDSINYERANFVPAVLAGGGYALRTDMGFRLNILIGWMKYIASMGNSTIKTTGNFDQQDRDQLQKDLDSTSDELVKGTVYLELGVGWAF